jgi:plastocyanin
MRIARLVAVAGLTFLLLPPAPASAATRTVDMPGNYYAPATIRVHVGDTVRWFNDTGTNHTVTSNSDSAESFNSSANCPGGLLGNDCIKPGRSFSHTFDSLGTFTYHCKRHGSDVSFPTCGMCGRVVVLRRSSSTAQPTTKEPTPTGTPTTISPSPSPSSPTPGSGIVSPTGTFKASGPEGGGSTPTLAIAAIGVALLAGSGFVVYRTMIRR